MNFLITGYGRSGTKFLSSLLNKSEVFTVKHEPRKNVDEINYYKHKLNYINIINEYFSSKNNYGKVNSYLRYWYKDINVDKKILLIRNPFDIFLSIINRHGTKKLNYYLDNFTTSFDDIIENESKFDKIIFFEQITVNKNTIQELLDFLNILDINIDEININKKINTNKSVKFNSWDKIPYHIKTPIFKKISKYAKYYKYNNTL